MINPVSGNVTDIVTGTTASSAADDSFSKIMQSTSENTKTSLDDIFERAAAKYNVPVSLLKAIGKAESGFNPDAVSRSGAQGVMQLMPATARSLGVTDSFDPEQNIMGGANYISQMLAKFDGDVSLALAAYNAGPGNVSKYGGIPPFTETQNYVQKVLGYMGGDLSTPNTALYSGSSASAVIARKEDSSALQGDLGTLLLTKIFEMMTSEDDENKIP